MQVLVLNGVNLDVLGRRDSKLYGGLSINELESRIYEWAHALELVEVPLVEVHLSNVEEREEWRRHSVVSEFAALRVIGKGPEGYREALEFLAGKEDA